MSSIVKLSALLVLLGVAACAQQEPQPEPQAAVIQPEPVFHGKP